MNGMAQIITNRIETLDPVKKKMMISPVRLLSMPPCRHCTIIQQLIVCSKNDIHMDHNSHL